MIPRLLFGNGSEYYSANKRDNFVKQLIARKLMSSLCAKQDHKMSVLCESFSDFRSHTETYIATE